MRSEKRCISSAIWHEILATTISEIIGSRQITDTNRAQAKNACCIGQKMRKTTYICEVQSVATQNS